MNAKHTPGPWFVTLRPDRIAHRGPLGIMRAVATAHAGRFIEDDMAGSYAGAILAPEAIANAAHIVRCVNSHDALLDALREAYRAFAHDDEGPVWSDSTIAKVRDALAAAGVQS